MGWFDIIMIKFLTYLPYFPINNNHHVIRRIYFHFIKNIYLIYYKNTYK